MNSSSEILADGSQIEAKAVERTSWLRSPSSVQLACDCLQHRPGLKPYCPVAACLQHSTTVALQYHYDAELLQGNIVPGAVLRLPCSTQALQHCSILHGMRHDIVHPCSLTASPCCSTVTRDQIPCTMHQCSTTAYYHHIAAS